MQNAERKKNIYQPKILYPEKLAFRIEGDIKTFPDKQKLKAFITTRPALQKTLKGLLQAVAMVVGKIPYKPSIEVKRQKC